MEDYKQGKEKEKESNTFTGQAVLLTGKPEDKPR